VLLEELSHKNLEVIVDATGQPSQWIASISKKNLICTNPEIDIAKTSLRVSPQEIIVKQSNLISEKIPVLITQPVGEAPKGYQFLDIWPYQLSLTVHGPEETIHRIKNRGLKLTFNLSDISRAELDTLQSSKTSGQIDEVSFYVPNSWKKISIPLLSEIPLEIDDVQAKWLRINFSKQDLLPIDTPIPVTVFFPPKFSHTLNPETYTLALNHFIIKKNGMKVVTTPLYAQGVSRLFLEAVKDMIQIVIIASPKSERETLLWNAQFMYPHELENRYIAKALAEPTPEMADIQSHMREEYLRNRFRSYMDTFRLYTANHKKLSLKIELQANTISVVPTPSP
jgi:hypothetical protein